MYLKLNLIPSEFESDDFASHVFGCPDVLSSWNDEENSVFNNDEVFFLQLNLQDYKIDNLPNKGILMFNISTMSHPYRAVVRYFDDFDNSERIDFNEEITGFNLNNEYEITMNDKYEGIELLGNMPKFINYHPNKNEICLLSFNKKMFNDIDLFNDYEEDIVCFVIDKNDLVNHDFSKVKLAVSLD